MRAIAGAIVALSLAAAGAGAAAKPGKPVAEAPSRGATTSETIAYSRCTRKQGDSCLGSAVFTSRVDGSRRRLLLRDASSPAWSRDGRRIAYIGRAGLWVARSDGSHRRRLANHPRRGLVSDPAWSPDGRRIVFYRERYIDKSTAGADLYVVVLKTRRLTPLTRSPSTFEFDPAWSPDGRQIAYRGANEAGDLSAQGIWVLDVATRRSRRLTSVYDDRSPDWSPDGTKIALARFGPAGGILVVNRDGSGRRKLISAAWVNSPSWSPGGPKIAYTAMPIGSESRIVVMRLGGTSRRVVVRGSEPDWRPMPSQ